MTTDPADLASSLLDLRDAVRRLDALLGSTSHSNSQLQPTTEELDEARALLAALNDAAQIALTNTEPAQPVEPEE
jgi:hypothetical protein